MNKIYIKLVLSLMPLLSMSQGYQFGIVHIENYDFKIVAIPDFDATENTDISDIGFTLVLPAGEANVVTPLGLLTGRTWTVQEFDASFLTSIGLGDNTKDVFQFNLPPGQSLITHSSGELIDLVSFQISNAPTSEDMFFLLNSDPIAIGASGVLDSFYNSDIDGAGVGSGTVDYFSGIMEGMETFIFSETLSDVEYSLLENMISVYPNPVTDYINVSSTLNIYKIELYNNLGQFILKSNLTHIDLSFLETGVYFLRVYYDDKYSVKKIVLR